MGLIFRSIVSAFFLGSAIALAADDLQFEVASVRGPTHPFVGIMKGGPGTSDPERISYTHVSMGRLISTAFGKRGDEVIAPDWVYESDAFTVPVCDVEAKVPRGATKGQAEEMMRNLLKSRFHLAYHFVKKDFDGYELVIGKGGPKLTPAAPPNGPAPERPGVVIGGAGMQRDKDGYPDLPPGYPAFRGMALNGRMLTSVRSQPVSVLEDLLQLPLSRQGPVRVVDHTGLSGKYDFKLEYAQITRDQDINDLLASAVAAVRKLGLDLKATKVPVDVMVIDHVDQTPAGN